MKKVVVLSLICIVAILSIGCADEINEPSISSVDIPKEKEVELGDDYTLPKTATATMSDGSEKAIKINWATEVDTSKVGRTKYEGVVIGYDYTVEITINVVDSSQEPIIVALEISPNEATVEVGENYTLPQIATATMSDGSKEEVTVTWNRAVDTSQPVKEDEYIGSAARTDLTVEFLLTVKAKPEIIDLEVVPNQAAVKVGSDYTLPQIATATMSDGSKKEVLVTWNKAVDTSQPVEREKYTGSVVNTDLTVSFYLTVIEDSPDPFIESLEINPNKATVKVGSDYTLPQIAMATMSDGSKKEVAITWDKAVDTSQPVEREKYTGSVNGTNLKVNFYLTVVEKDALIGIDIDWDRAPQAPTNVSATFSSGKVVINWDRVDQDLAAQNDSSKEFGGYYIYRSTVRGKLGTAINSSLIAEDSYTDRNVEAGKTYYYQLRAYGGRNGNLAGNLSQEVSCQ